MKNLKMLAIALVTITSFSSCSSDDSNGPVNEEEVITTVTATFTPQGGGTPIVLRSRDLDGDSGPDAPLVTVSGNFTAGMAYNGTVTFMNELSNPAEDITAEVQQEGTQHQVFFQHSGIGTFVYSDDDADGNPIGLAFVYTASVTPGSGNLSVILKHEPDKNGQGVSGGNMANADGNTDAQVNFSVVIE